MPLTTPGARGVYVTRRPYLLGGMSDYQPSCESGQVIVDLYGDGSMVMCVPNEPDIIGGITSTGGRIIGYAGRGPSPGVTVNPTVTAGAPMPGQPAAAGGGGGIMAQLEHVTGLNGSSLAIGMVVLLLLTRGGKR